MTELRSCRRQLGLSQAELADLFSVPLNSLRMWDSGLRLTPVPILMRARAAVSDAVRDEEPITLLELAVELKVHVRTLQAAARTGRLEVHYATRSVFGRPLRLSTRAAGTAFLQIYYNRYGGQCPGTFGVPEPAPVDYQRQLRELRRRFKLSQGDLAELVAPSCISGDLANGCPRLSSGVAFCVSAAPASVPLP